MNEPGNLDISQLLQGTRQMNQHLAQATEDLKTLTATGAAGGGAVRVRVDSKGVLTELVISRAVADPANAQGLADLVLAAVRDAQGAIAAQQEAQLLPMLQMIQSQLGGLQG
ncbi:YbaB/EbfC family nucleoid-associated protein [Streptomyces sp. NPDC013178]|uniref:YbaB/EbfC family nucleoid-associated protein n=1 Tax=Streptomyces sp. NPDC013178 TaxID=3155118 RepID=UPI0033EA7235